jgi:hypothetical protein
MKWEIHPTQALLSRTLYVPRLRHTVPGWVGKMWIHRTVKMRRKEIQSELDRGMRQWRDKKRWLPDHGRESPREEWMGWRRNYGHYEYPGCVGRMLRMQAMDQSRHLRDYGSAMIYPKMYTLDRPTFERVEGFPSHLKERHPDDVPF